MKESYSKTTWIDKKTAINATRLNKIEDALYEIFDRATEGDQIKEGDGLIITNTKEGDKVFSVSTGIPRSNSVRGIEVSIGEPGEIKRGVLYFILDPSTSYLMRIQWGKIVIYQNIDID